MQDHRLCVLNAGSSSLKFAVYGVANGALRRWQSGEVEQVGGKGRLLVSAADGKPMHDQVVSTADHAAALDALRRARATLDDVHGIEVHDCFTPSEYLAIDHIGLTGPGESWKAIENGEIEIGGRLPINPSGGLIGGGHPVGASGIRMLVDAAKQVSGAAGDYQVEGAKTFGTLNFGGSTATTVSFVVRATEGS